MKENLESYDRHSIRNLEKYEISDENWNVDRGLSGVGLRPNVVFRTTPAVGHQDPPRDSVFLERHGAWVGLKPTRGLKPPCNRLWPTTIA